MATVTVYKMGASTQINDFDLDAYKRMGWSTSKTSSSPAPSTPTPSSAPTPSPSSSSPSRSSSPTQVTIYNANGQSKTVPSFDVNYWTGKGWSTSRPSAATPSTAPAPAPTPAPSTTPSNTAPPAGATLIKSPSELARYTESQLWRDPNSDKIYLRSGQQSVDQTPVSSPQPTTTPEQTQPTGLNTSGLLQAWSRKQNGTANPTDLANLDYAMSKGWTPPGGSSTQSQTQTSDQGTQSGGDNQNIPGLNTVGLNEAYARKVAGTANATDLANLDYAMSKGWKPNSGLANTVTEADKANELINSQQDADINAKSTADGVETRKTTDDIMNEIRESIQPDTERPDAPNYEQSLRDLRTEYGIEPLENQLNDLNGQLEDLYAIRKQRIEAEKNKTVATNVIAGRVSEVEKQENERIAELESSISKITNQLNTKLSVVNSLMGAKELDYNTAVQDYDAQMKENITLFNAAQGIEESLKSEEQRAIDNARSSAQILMNGYLSAGMSYADLTPTQQSTIQKLAVESGFDPSFYETVMSVTGEVQKEVLTQIISDDKSQVSIVYKDGTTATIPTGFRAGANVPAGGFKSGGSSTSTEDKEIAKFRSESADLVGKLDSGEISWGTAWDQLHIKYPNASPQLIDQTLGGGYDPASESYYGRGTYVANK